MMNFSPFAPLILLGVVLIICLFLHWLIGAIKNKLARKFAVAPAESDSVQVNQSLKKLYADWAAKAARTFIWLIFFVFALELVPALQNDLLKAKDSFERLLTRTSEWLLGNGLIALIVLIITILVMRFTAALIKTTFSFYENRFTRVSNEYLQRRSQTLSVIMQGIAQTIIFFIGLMVALQQGGLNITPILASAGIVGLAIGFGAQSLIKDIFNGLVILFEEQYSVGDTIKIGDVTGTVETLTLRATRVRGGDGALTIFPNGGIATVANLSREFLRVVLEYEIDYAADVDQAMALMLDTAKQLWVEKGSEILEEPAMQGVDKIANGNVTLRLSFKAIPSKQAEITRELRRRVKLAFDVAGIKGPVKAERS